MILIKWHVLSSKYKRKINFVIDYHWGGQNIVRGVSTSLRYFDPGVKISWGSKYRLTPAPCWRIVPVMAHNVQTGHYMFVSADRTASTGALLNTSSEVFISNTRHKCSLYLYLMFCQNYQQTLFHVCMFVYLHIGFCNCFIVFVTTLFVSYYI